MKEHTGVIIGITLIVSAICTTLAVNKHIKDNGGKVETIFNTPLREIFKP
jgi:hypothetical protein